ncbi:hypothetical protein M9H77_26227 [Catharanthus roseus]|uniref:Uncharacterized protein n=1 Tax=Catharanthus roseus TaxID=4058 RepID=A0ACC0AB92_CATRO|nr:hypothetical protein M9H77_26227 [Catharanthus roseus]
MVVSSTSHMPISYASSSDSDEQTDDATPALQLGFGNRVGKNTIRDCKRYVWSLFHWNGAEKLDIADELNDITYRTGKKNIKISRNGSQSLERLNEDEGAFILRKAFMTITQMVSDEQSMLYPTVNDDDDEIDHSNEDYVISNQSESDDNNDAEEEELQTPINPVTENRVTQLESSQWFSSSKYD